MMQKPPRPTGVTILGVLAILGGIIGILAGAAALGFSGLAAAAGSSVGTGFLLAAGAFD